MVRRRSFLLGASALPLIGTGTATAHADPTAPPAPLDAGRAAADYWIRTMSLGGNDWHDAILHSGVMALYRATNDTRYRDYTLSWANRHNFALRSSSGNPHFADHQAAGQAYLDLYEDNPEPRRRAAIVREIDATIATRRTDYWWWVDALHMALPIYARLGRMDYGDRLYRYTRQRLWNNGLWWRDGKFVNKNIYWSRGNGWAIAALAKVLNVLPPESPYRAGYVNDFKQMAAKLAQVQRADGFWNVNLGDPANYPGPETSGTAFFTYGLAWGVRKGVLDAATYRPVAVKAWDGMLRTALQNNGRLGYVQGVGQQPSDHQPVGRDDTSNFSVGAFLLASSEVAEL
ncbi:glycoside hydrolase family 88 protein [Lentzea sp. BCCO 10_0856]|uniref:Glycoside hydrolase family 88 protein n=1 Tax=Lentzea miocenica TaxID=3095431 RepID=A0ABU4STA0_9PSEU|nr:glycoside hydrolase family 88 protein [Lentzea sp. BCCO 10_0856]MDX8029106.1 glycoside hydrolase family 88 protein [Lentzea sp. BCCO 10_0856]